MSTDDRPALDLVREPHLREIATPGGRVTRMWLGKTNAAGVGREVTEVVLHQSPTPTRLRPAWAAVHPHTEQKPRISEFEARYRGVRERCRQEKVYEKALCRHLQDRYLRPIAPIVVVGICLALYVILNQHNGAAYSSAGVLGVGLFESLTKVLDQRTDLWKTLDAGSVPEEEAIGKVIDEIFQLPENERVPAFAKICNNLVIENEVRSTDRAGCGCIAEYDVRRSAETGQGARR